VLGGLVPGFISLIWGMRQREAILIGLISFGLAVLINH
jgi:hypothetical protein